MAPEQMTGVILSGGKNSRMGTNKAFLEIDGQRLIDRTVGIFRQLFAEIIIVTNAPLSYLDQNVTLVADVFQNKGALGGLHTGLFFASHNQAFVCACDMPFLNGAFIEFMIRQADNYDIVVPDAGDGLQPLHGIYGKRCLPVMENLLTKNKLKIINIYKGLKTLVIQESLIEPFDLDKKMFLNVNTYEDLQKIRPTAEVAPCRG